jgi:hypothetical protein
LARFLFSKLYRNFVKAGFVNDLRELAMARPIVSFGAAKWGVKSAIGSLPLPYAKENGKKAEDRSLSFCTQACNCRPASWQAG